MGTNKDSHIKGKGIGKDMGIYKLANVYHILSSYNTQGPMSFTCHNDLRNRHKHYLHLQERKEILEFRYLAHCNVAKSGMENLIA